MQFTLLVASLLIVLNIKSQDIISVKLELKQESGPFRAKALTGKLDTSNKCSYSDTGLLPKQVIWYCDLDKVQTAFTDYIKTGRKDTVILKKIIENGVDTNTLSKTELNTKIYTLAGIDSNNRFVLIPDVNRNGTFFDDQKYFYDRKKIVSDSVGYYYRTLPFHTFDIETYKNGKLDRTKIYVKFEPRSFFGNFRPMLGPAIDTLKMLNTVDEHFYGQFTLENALYSIYVKLDEAQIRYNKTSEPEIRVAKGVPESPGDLYKSSYRPYYLEDTIHLEDNLLKIAFLSEFGDTIQLKYVGKDSSTFGIHVGKQAIPFTRTAISGDTVNLYNLKQDYILLDFWSSYCGPCLEGMKKLKKTFDKVSNKKLAIIGIAVDNDLSKVQKILQLNNIKWMNILDMVNSRKESLYEFSYKMYRIPGYIVLDKNKKIIFRGFEFNKLEKFLRTQLKM